MKKIFTSKILVILLLAAALTSGISGCNKKAAPDKISVTFTGPAGMTMSYNGKDLTGLTRNLRPGSYIFKFTAPGRKTVWKEFSFSRTDDKNSIAIDMEAERSVILVRCTTEDPAKDGNATVLLNGEEKGVTPCLITGIAPGVHSLELTHPGYASKTIQLNVSGARPLPQIRESLVSISGILRISGSPAGAMLYINDKLAGPIPYQAKYAAGKYQVELRAPGYTSQRKEISLRPNSSTKTHIELEPEPSSITIETTPPNAVCTVRGEKRGTTPIRIDNLQPGNYKIELSLDGYDTIEETVEVKAGSHEHLKITMESGFGFARLNVRPAGIDIFVDGRLIGRTKATGSDPNETEPVKISDLSPGRHVCTISHPRAKPKTVHRFEFVVAKNKTTECPVVEMWVADCELTYNNGMKEEVKLLRLDNQEVEFSLQPGISMREKRSNVEIRRLPQR